MVNNTVVVGVTDASASRRAAAWAIDRAADRHERVALVAVVGGALGVVGEGPILEAGMRRAADLLERHAVTARERGVIVTTRVARGNPVSRLIDASRDSTLLVIGSDYRGPNAGPERGPHGIRIAAGAHCPVAVVPDLDLSGRSGIVVGVDGSDASEAAIAFAAAEADRTGEHLTAVSAWMPIPLPLDMHGYPGDYLENMQRLTEESAAISLAGLRQQYPDQDLRRVVERGFPAAVIGRLAADARMTVVGSHGRGALGRFLLGSVSQQVLARLATTTVVVR
jgi:nucleotide-binding universal stress UspA family protein